MKLTQDQFIGSCLTATLAKDNSPLVDVGFLRDENGNLYCENTFQHADVHRNDEASITDPSELKYTMTLNDATIALAHVCVPIGMGTILSRLEADDIPALRTLKTGDTISIRIDVLKPDGKKKIKTLLCGSFVVPERRHALGYPGGPEGFMVQVFAKNFLFVQPARGRVTFQINLCDYEIE